MVGWLKVVDGPGPCNEAATTCGPGRGTGAGRPSRVVVGYRLVVVGWRPVVVGYRLVVVGYRLVVVG